MKPIVSIIIVNHNTPDLVCNCLKTIKQFIKGLDYEVILVENGSAKGKRLSEDKVALAIGSGVVSKFQSSKAKKQSPKKELGNSATQQLGNSFGHYPPWKLVALKSNRGFGGGNNAGVKLAKGKYLFLLNPDTLLVDDSITRMLTFLDTHPKIGAISPLLYQKDGKTLQEGFYGPFQSFSMLLTRNSFATSPLGNSETLYPDRISAAAMMVKRELFEKINGFDERIFMYMEDDDLCKRIANLGYKIAVFAEAKIIHLEGQASTNKLKKRFYYKSQSYFWRKHYGLLPTLMMQVIRFPYKATSLIKKR